MEFHFHEGNFNFLIVNRLSSVLIKSITRIRTFSILAEIRLMYSAFLTNKKTPVNGYMYIVDVKCVLAADG